MIIYTHTSEREFLVKTIMNILKNNKIKPIFAGIVIGICLSGIVMPQITNADFASPTNASYVVKSSNEAKTWYHATLKVVVTAYSSTSEQTDDSPFITASNKYVKDGIIANNMLPFGTKVKIPSLYGNKIFVVEDRMNKRMGNHRFDIWMPSYEQAVNFGVKTVDMEVL